MNILKQLILQIDELFPFAESFPIVSILIVILWAIFILIYFDAMLKGIFFIPTVLFSIVVTMLSLFMLSRLPNDPSAYSVGSCYGEKGVNELETINQRISSLENSITTYKTLTEVKKMNNESSKNEEDLINSFKQEIDTLNEKKKAKNYTTQDKIKYIIVKVNNYSNIAYSFQYEKHIPNYIKVKGDSRVDCGNINVDLVSKLYDSEKK